MGIELVGFVSSGKFSYDLVYRSAALPYSSRLLEAFFVNNLDYYNEMFNLRSSAPHTAVALGSKRYRTYIFELTSPDHEPSKPTKAFLPIVAWKKLCRMQGVS